MVVGEVNGCGWSGKMDEVFWNKKVNKMMGFVLPPHASSG